MRALRAILGTGVFFALLGGAADATVLTTPVLRVFEGQGLLCHVLNLTEKPHDVTLEILNAFDGSQVYKNSGTVAAGTFFVVTSGGPTIQTVYCRFTVNGAPKAKLRGAIANETTGMSLPAQ